MQCSRKVVGIQISPFSQEQYPIVLENCMGLGLGSQSHTVADSCDWVAQVEQMGYLDQQWKEKFSLSLPLEPSEKWRGGGCSGCDCRVVIYPVAPLALLLTVSQQGGI